LSLVPPPDPAARFPSGVALAISSPEDLPGALDGVTSLMAARGYSAKDIFALRLALEEALVNALKHGHNYDLRKQVRVRYQVTADEVLAEVEDQGAGFDPGSVADPRLPQNRERSCGRGLLLMRHYLTWLRYNERGNSAILCKRRSPSEVNPCGTQGG